MRAFTESHRDGLTVVRLPAYAPDLNPAEGAWANRKNGVGNLAVRDAGQLAAIVRNRLQRIQPARPRRRVPRPDRTHPRTRAAAATQMLAFQSLQRARPGAFAIVSFVSPPLKEARISRS
jgi:hypothetical protein